MKKKMTPSRIALAVATGLTAQTMVAQTTQNVNQSIERKKAGDGTETVPMIKLDNEYNGQGFFDGKKKTSTRAAASPVVSTVESKTTSTAPAVTPKVEARAPVNTKVTAPVASAPVVSAAPAASVSTPVVAPAKTEAASSSVATKTADKPLPQNIVGSKDAVENTSKALMPPLEKAVKIEKVKVKKRAEHKPRTAVVAHTSVAPAVKAVHSDDIPDLSSFTATPITVVESAPTMPAAIPTQEIMADLSPVVVSEVVDVASISMQPTGAVEAETVPLPKAPVEEAKPVLIVQAPSVEEIAQSSNILPKSSAVVAPAPMEAPVVKAETPPAEIIQVAAAPVAAPVANAMVETSVVAPTSSEALSVNVGGAVQKVVPMLITNAAGQPMVVYVPVATPSTPVAAPSAPVVASAPVAAPAPVVAAAPTPIAAPQVVASVPVAPSVRPAVRQAPAPVVDNVISMQPPLPTAPEAPTKVVTLPNKPTDASYTVNVNKPLEVIKPQSAQIEAVTYPLPPKQHKVANPKWPGLSESGDFVAFDAGSSSVSPQTEASLQNLVALFKEQGIKKIALTGTALRDEDSEGLESSEFAKRRAVNLKAALQKAGFGGIIVLEDPKRARPGTTPRVGLVALK